MMARNLYGVSWDEAKKELLKDPEIRKAYEAIDLAYEVGKSVADARIARGITQAELARRAHTQQPSIARLEAGNILPSLTYLQRIADALDADLTPPTLTLKDIYNE